MVDGCEGYRDSGTVRATGLLRGTGSLGGPKALLRCTWSLRGQYVAGHLCRMYFRDVSGDSLIAVGGGTSMWRVHVCCLVLWYCFPWACMM